MPGRTLVLMELLVLILRGKVLGKVVTTMQWLALLEWVSRFGSLRATLHVPSVLYGLEVDFEEERDISSSFFLVSGDISSRKC